MAQEKARRCKGISGNLNTKLPAKVAALTLRSGRDSSALRSLDSSLTEVCRTKAHAWDQERASETRGGQREGGTQSTHEHKGKNRTQLLKQNKSHPTSQQQPDVSHPPPRRHHQEIHFLFSMVVSFFTLIALRSNRGGTMGSSFLRPLPALCCRSSFQHRARHSFNVNILQMQLQSVAGSHSRGIFSQKYVCIFF